MNGQLFTELDRLLAAGTPEAALDFLIARYRGTGEFGLLFEARLMRVRHTMGLPLIQSEAIDESEYQDAVIAAAREAGELFLAAGKIGRAWPFFRAIGQTAPVAEAIGRLTEADLPDSEEAEMVISIAFQEGVHPRKGLELILARQGICRAITALGMTAVSKDRDACLGILARHVWDEIVRRVGDAVEAREGTRPETSSLPELLADRPWLFGEWDYYADTSHVLSVIGYSPEVRDRDTLTLLRELCDYGQRLNSQFRAEGVPPFVNQFEAYGHYVSALLGEDVESHIAYFRRQVADSDPDVDGDAPGRALTRLLLAVGRPAEALQALLDHVFEDAPYGAPVPTALQICYQAGDFAALRNLARDRGDALSYAAGSILAGSK